MSRKESMCTCVCACARERERVENVGETKVMTAIACSCFCCALHIALQFSEKKIEISVVAHIFNYFSGHSFIWLILKTAIKGRRTL